MDLGRLYLPETQIQALTACARSFSTVGVYRPAHNSESAGTECSHTAVEYAHPHMRPIQWYLKQRWTHTIFVNKDLICSLLWWSYRHRLSHGMPFTFPNMTISITTDASMEG